MADYQSTLELRADTRGVTQKLAKVNSEVDGVGKRLRSANNQFDKVGTQGVSAMDMVGKEANKTSSILGKLKLALAGVATVAGATVLGKSIASSASKFEVLRAQLKTMTGSAENASVAFDRLKAFADVTPFDFEQSIRGFTKLKALGLVSTIDEGEAALRSYGNTAAAMGKTLEQFVEAVADAATGENERLKEFGIKARKEGELTAFTFQGVTTKVANNAADIQAYLKSIGDVQFAGAMEEQAQGITAAMSNLRTNFALFLDAMGTGLGITNALTKAFNGLSSALNASSEWLLREDNALKKLGAGLKNFKELYITALIDPLQGPEVVITRLVQAFKNGMSSVANSIISANIPAQMEVVRAKIYDVAEGISDWFFIYELAAPVRYFRSGFLQIEGVFSRGLDRVVAITENKLGLIDKAMAKVSIKISKASIKLVDALTPIYGVGSTIAGRLGITLKAAVNILSTALTTMADLSAKAVKLIIEAFDFLYDVLVGNSIIPDLASEVMGYWSDMLEFLGAESLGDTINGIISGIDPSSVQSRLESIGELFRDYFSTIITSAKGFAQSVGKEFSKLSFDNIGDPLKKVTKLFTRMVVMLPALSATLVKNVLAEFYYLAKELVGASIIPDMVDDVTYYWESMLNFLGDHTGQSLGIMLANFTSFSGEVINILFGLRRSLEWTANSLDDVAQVWRDSGKTIGITLGNISEQVERNRNLVDSLGKSLNRIAVVGLGVGIVVNRDAIFDEIGGIFDDLQNQDWASAAVRAAAPVDLYFSSIIDSISTLFDALLAGATADAGTFEGLFRRTFDSIEEGIDKILDHIGGLATVIVVPLRAAFGTLKSVIGGVVSLLTGIDADSIAGDLIAGFVAFKLSILAAKKAIEFLKLSFTSFAGDIKTGIFGGVEAGKEATRGHKLGMAFRRGYQKGVGSDVFSSLMTNAKEVFQSLKTIFIERFKQIAIKMKAIGQKNNVASSLIGEPGALKEKLAKMGAKLIAWGGSISTYFQGLAAKAKTRTLVTSLVGGDDAVGKAAASSAAAIAAVKAPFAVAKTRAQAGMSLAEAHATGGPAAPLKITGIVSAVRLSTEAPLKRAKVIAAAAPSLAELHAVGGPGTVGKVAAKSAAIGAAASKGSRKGFGKIGKIAAVGASVFALLGFSGAASASEAGEEAGEEVAGGFTSAIGDFISNWGFEIAAIAGPALLSGLSSVFSGSAVLTTLAGSAASIFALFSNPIGWGVVAAAVIGFFWDPIYEAITSGIDSVFDYFSDLGNNLIELGKDAGLSFLSAMEGIVSTATFGLVDNIFNADIKNATRDVEKILGELNVEIGEIDPATLQSFSSFNQELYTTESLFGLFADDKNYKIDITDNTHQIAAMNQLLRKSPGFIKDLRDSLEEVDFDTLSDSAKRQHTAQQAILNSVKAESGHLKELLAARESIKAAIEGSVEAQAVFEKSVFNSLSAAQAFVVIEDQILKKRQELISAENEAYSLQVDTWKTAIEEANAVEKLNEHRQNYASSMKDFIKLQEDAVEFAKQYRSEEEKILDSAGEKRAEAEKYYKSLAIGEEEYKRLVQEINAEQKRLLDELTAKQDESNKRRLQSELELFTKIKALQTGATAGGTGVEAELARSNAANDKKLQQLMDFYDKGQEMFAGNSGKLKELEISFQQARIAVVEEGERQAQDIRERYADKEKSLRKRLESIRLRAAGAGTGETADIAATKARYEKQEDTARKYYDELRGLAAGNAEKIKALNIAEVSDVAKIQEAGAKAVSNVHTKYANKRAEAARRVAEEAARFIDQYTDAGLQLQQNRAAELKQLEELRAAGNAYLQDAANFEMVRANIIKDTLGKGVQDAMSYFDDLSDLEEGQTKTVRAQGQKRLAEARKMLNKILQSEDTTAEARGQAQMRFGALVKEVNREILEDTQRTQQGITDFIKSAQDEVKDLQIQAIPEGEGRDVARFNLDAQREVLAEQEKLRSKIKEIQESSLEDTEKQIAIEKVQAVSQEKQVALAKKNVKELAALRKKYRNEEAQAQKKKEDAEKKAAERAKKEAERLRKEWEGLHQVWAGIGQDLTGDLKSALSQGDFSSIGDAIGGGIRKVFERQASTWLDRAFKPLENMVDQAFTGSDPFGGAEASLFGGSEETENLWKIHNEEAKQGMRNTERIVDAIRLSKQSPVNSEIGGFGNIEASNTEMMVESARENAIRTQAAIRDSGIRSVGAIKGQTAQTEGFFGQLGSMFSSGLQWVGDALGSGFSGIGGLFSGLGGGGGGGIGGLISGLFGGGGGGLLGGIGSFFGGLFAEGGEVRGPGTGTSDDIMAMLSNGEFVVNAEAAKMHRPLLEAINSGKMSMSGFAENLPHYQAGGAVGGMSPAPIVPMEAGATNNEMGGVTINQTLNITEAMDPKAFQQELVKNNNVVVGLVQKAYTRQGMAGPNGYQ